MQERVFKTHKQATSHAQGLRRTYPDLYVKQKGNTVFVSERRGYVSSSVHRMGKKDSLNK
jgi:hypothetical protein